MHLAGRPGRKPGHGFYRYAAEGGKLSGPPAPLPSATKPARVILPEPHEGLVALAVAAGVEAQAPDDGASPIVVAAWGEDCTAAALRLGLDPRRTGAVDLSHDTSKRLTQRMAASGHAATGRAVAAALA